MVTDITAYTSGGVVAEDHSWTIGEWRNGATDNAPLDYALFTGTNFDTGIIKSGCVLGKVTASGKYGPYDPAAGDGRNVAVGMLFNTTRIPADRTRVASDAVLIEFTCNPKRLPYQTGLGSLDAAARTALRHTIFV